MPSVDKIKYWLINLIVLELFYESLINIISAISANRSFFLYLHLIKTLIFAVIFISLLIALNYDLWLLIKIDYVSIILGIFYYIFEMMFYVDHFTRKKHLQPGKSTSGPNFYLITDLINFIAHFVIAIVLHVYLDQADMD